MVKRTQYRYLGLQSSMIKLLKHQLIKIMRKRRCKQEERKEKTCTNGEKKKKREREMV